MDAHQRLPVQDSSHAGEARRLAATLAARLGMDEQDVGRVSLVVMEAATNILKHAGRGELLLRPLHEAADQPGVELLALDRGPGMADVARCLRDGFSTAGSPGNGLGAMARLSSSFDVFSQPGAGTALLARLLPRGARLRAERVVVGAVRVAAPGETECGDAWAVSEEDSRTLLMVADGLGHGPAAAQAAAEAVRVFCASHGLSLERILATAHRALLPTRGAAVSIAELDLVRGEVRYAGVGNVLGLLAWPGGSRGMVGQNGTLGAEARSIHPNTYPWTPGACLVLYSDGLTSQLGLERYPGLLSRHPSLTAGVLFRDHVRGRDDATVLVAREAEARR